MALYHLMGSILTRYGRISMFCPPHPTDFLHHTLSTAQSMLPQSMDLVVAADLVPYFGDLAELLRAIETVTRPGGLFAFNADLMDREDDVSGAGSSSASGRAYELRFTGRQVLSCPVIVSRFACCRLGCRQHLRFRAQCNDYLLTAPCVLSLRIAPTRDAVCILCQHAEDDLPQRLFLQVSRDMMS